MSLHPSINIVMSTSSLSIHSWTHPSNPDISSLPSFFVVVGVFAKGIGQENAANFSKGQNVNQERR
jgi:hypothetical protein